MALDDIEVRLRHDRLPVADDGDHKQDPQQIVQRVTLFGALDEHQRRLLLTIAARCPVHRTLVHSDLEILTEADGDDPATP
jgi:putative redox protein